ncbi:hypothetical protein KIN20_000177 [Parelaphostrongylus tenuis]|uniref:Uncharacterized protein n=1 Tax=Parelaphostrongylus tenuis TaxID=148309 RepID=A0AAD5MCW2_PARTN|nr:hypothetical protein KIN20_000177 [Parelaphostrongylus tenuis]
MYRDTSIHKQLYMKANQLMTNFDLHATIMDILKLQPETGFSDTSYRDLMPISKGSSLLREWRGPRNCRTLPIPSAYCICQYEWKNVTDRGLIAKLGKFFSNQLNELLRNNGLLKMCKQQFYNEKGGLRVNLQNYVTVFHCRLLSVKQLQIGDATLYEMVVYVIPSGGLFSAYIRSNSSGLFLSSGFSRLNLYGKQAECLIDNPLRPLCHCRNTTKR